MTDKPLPPDGISPAAGRAEPRVAEWLSAVLGIDLQRLQDRFDAADTPEAATPEAQVRAALIRMAVLPPPQPGDAPSDTRSDEAAAEQASTIQATLGAAETAASPLAAFYRLCAVLRGSDEAVHAWRDDGFRLRFL